MKLQDEKAVKKKLRVGVIGCGKMGINHLKAVNSLGNAELVAVSDKFGPTERVQPLLGKARFYEDHRELLAEARPDVVHIITPPASHASIARDALNAGAHVYVEKPFTLRRSEAEEMLGLAKARGLRVCPGHQVLFQEPSRIVKESVGEIGRIVHIESYFSFRMVRRNVTAVEQLMDILPHPVYTLLNFLPGKDAPALSGIVADPGGEVRATLSSGGVSGSLVVTLNGRPVESYLRIVGANGSLHADFVRNIVIRQVGPGASAVSIILAPYSQSLQAVSKTTMAFARLALKGRKTYPGLAELAGAFYSSILSGGPSPFSNEAILNAVGACETIGDRLEDAWQEQEKAAERRLADTEEKMEPVDPRKSEIVLTGGTGFLGCAVARTLRGNGWPVHVLSRRVPPFGSRIPGVRYSKADLSVSPVPDGLLRGAHAVVHCSAETAGGMEEHERNSVNATSNIIEAASRAGVGRFIHISSVAVLKPGGGRRVSESSELDAGNRARGPYVWGKAESERIVTEKCPAGGMDFRIIRLGPLIDFTAYKPPGRLGRELGPVYAAVGSKDSRLPICEVQTAAEVILSYLEDFKAAPAVLNLVDPAAPTREGLVKRLLDGRPDLKAFWVPFFVVSSLSPALKVLQRVLLKSKNPIDIKGAFSAEDYDTALSAEVIARARGPRKQQTR